MEHHDFFQDARETVARLELLALAAETETQHQAVLKQYDRAKETLNDAFHFSAPAEQDQIIQMQEHLQRLMH
ncbi:hypothetical protein JCM9140_1227 [Halalkalibacter wakoensis JCM 9140]|uniref:Uncharacterized protein n=1 Tax=Halalkalibacter wakoensis JCM 9140 TaxID=1236970 RepID=W4PZX1_9BACI|nr:DUF3813 family protein [Halalkalibacter wakoensis]GAE25245.1 hypothetical protein JCM9140_1227 [Halalkalibacter wakoensis JCM 9140]